MTSRVVKIRGRFDEVLGTAEQIGRLWQAHCFWSDEKQWFDNEHDAGVFAANTGPRPLPRVRVFDPGE